MTASMFFLGAKRRGRVPRAGVRAAERVSVVMTTEELDGLRIVAAENGVKMSEVIREAVNSYVGDYSDRTGPFARATFGGTISRKS